MGMGDDAADIVERNPPNFLAVFRDRQEAAMDGNVQAVGC